MDKSTQKRINNSNRKRGGDFEKRVADFLDMDVVPYSGSNERYGYGDVRDSIWLGECKNISPSSMKITLKREWFDKLMERAKLYGKLPYLAWMPYGKAVKYVVLDYATFNQYFMEYTNGERFGVQFEQTSVNNHNLIIHLDSRWMPKIKTDSGVAVIAFDKHVWYMMRIERFKRLMDQANIKGERAKI